MKQANTDELVAGFSLIEAMATLALTATIILALSSVAGQWLPNWRRGFVDLQRADLLGAGLERLVDDLSAAEYVTPSAGSRGPLFEGDASSVMFVRSAIGPDAYPHLEIVRLAEIKEDRGLAMVRTRARFAPTAPKSPGAPAQSYRLRRSCHPHSRTLSHFLRLCRTRPCLASELERSGAAARGGADIGAGHSRQSGASGVDRGAHQGHIPRRAQASGASECGRRSSYGRTAGAAMKTPAMTSLPGSATRAENGFVLIAVLWILAALATLASIYSSYTVNTAAASRVADDRVQAEASIRAGVEMAVFRQLAAPEKVRPARGGFDMRVGRTGVSVRFRSEGARIDLNAAPPDLLAGLFTAVGVDSSRAETFAERIVGWRTKANAGADANGAARRRKCGKRQRKRGGRSDATLAVRRTRPPRRTSFITNSTCLIRRATPHSTTRWSSAFCRGFR